MKKTLLLASFFVGAVSTFAQKLPYQNSSFPIEKRVSDLLSRMTLDEKIAQMRHIHSENFDNGGKPNLVQLNSFTNGLGFGCIEAVSYTSAQFASAMSIIQHQMIEKTRLHIPIIPVMEGLHGTVQDGCTIYPQSIALASTFNPSLAYQMASHIAGEMKAIGVKQVLAPDLDLARELRWGRVEETYGEDPYLVAMMGTEYVKAMRKNKIICTPKHFVAHGSPLGGLNLAGVEGGQRELFSLYLPPFEKVIQKGDPLSIMNCYSSYDGAPITGSNYFLTEILRNKLKFKGYVYSDWGSVSMLYSFHRTALDASDAAKQAVAAGVDLEAGGEDFKNIKSLIESKSLDIKTVDKAVANILYAKFKCGLFDDPYADSNNLSEKIHTAESVKLSKQIADESIVLLKNENKLLPLAIENMKSIAVVGPNADQVQFGDYSWSRDNKDGITPLQGIKNVLNNKARINYAKGCDLTSQSKDGFAAAIDAASKSDVTVVFVGSQSASLARDYKNATSGEGFDLSDLKLPGVQEELIRAIQEKSKKVIVVLVTGKPFAIQWEKENIPAIITQWYGGEQEGNAIAEMLFGITNPSGKLPVSFPQSVGHLPAYYNYLPTDKGFYKKTGTLEKPGRDYVFSNPDALYSFGHGLSYTTFSFSNLSLSKEVLKPTDTLAISLQVKNTGDRSGAEVVQLYVRDVVSSVVTPIQQLKGFKKVVVNAKEDVTVNLKLPISELFLYNAEMKKLVEPGEFELMIGNASNNILLKKKIVVTNEKGEILNVPNVPANKSATTDLNKVNGENAGKQITIKGIIRDVQATLLEGVEVKIKGSDKIVLTDANGAFSIAAREHDVLQFIKKGFKAAEKKIEGNVGVLSIKLTTSNED
jgi:beta-glucosidase